MSLRRILLNNNLYILYIGLGGFGQVEVPQLTCRVCVQGWLKTLMLQVKASCNAQQLSLVTKSKL